MSQYIQELSARPREKSILTDIIATALPISALLLACVLSFQENRPISITHPSLLLLAAGFLFLPHQIKIPTELRVFIVFYLFCIPINEISSTYLVLPLRNSVIKISYSFFIVFPCIVGFLLGLIHREKAAIRSDTFSDILKAWALAIFILISHLGLLAIVLSIYYGYGYENDLRILGQICLYLFLFVLLLKIFSKEYLQKILGAILAIYYFLLCWLGS